MILPDRQQVLSDKLRRWLEQRTSPLRADLSSRQVDILDQRDLPYQKTVRVIRDFDQAKAAIATMQVRGAPLLGLCAAYGLAMGLDWDASDKNLKALTESMKTARPTAVNLAYSLDFLFDRLQHRSPSERAEVAWQLAKELEMADRDQTIAIGCYGLTLIEEIAQKKSHVGILTHCNAGRLATAGIGTALAPIYCADLLDIAVCVYVDETRPRNQGYLTAWELADAGVSHRVIVDNAGGHFMQHGLIDLCLVGADRVTQTGDVCNKVGTYLKALAAFDQRVPFYSAFPLSTVDWSMKNGIAEIPIEERAGAEIYQITGMKASGKTDQLRLLSDRHPVVNPGFDVTPARLMTGLITEKGICSPTELMMQKPQ